jgi:putative tryptophan/tyrosine transport system substrate-binding protein
VKRRDFVRLAGGAAVGWPLATRAQQVDPMKRIGVLMGVAEDDPEGRTRFRALQRGLQELGWMEGRNLRLEVRWAAGDQSRYQKFAAELAGIAPDVILCGSGPRGLKALLQETRTIPIVSVGVSDPAGQGLVTSMARPSGNVTGFSLIEFSIVGKMLETLIEVAPNLSRVMLMFNPDNPSAIHFLHSFEGAALSLAVLSTTGQIHNGEEIERAMERLAGEPRSGLVIPPDTLALFNRELIIGLAARHRLPAIYYNRAFTANGGLMSYGVDLADI